MSIENTLAKGKQITFGGELVTVRRATGIDTLRAINILNRLKKKLGLSDDDIAGMDLSFKTVRLLTESVWKLGVDSIDLSTDKLSDEMGLIFGEIGRYIGKTAEEVVIADLDDAFLVLSTILEQEREGFLGRRVQAIVGQWQTRITQILDVVLMMVKTQAYAGGTVDGGMTGSSTPSETPMDGQTSTS